MRAQACYVLMLKGEVESAELEILKGRVAISFYVFAGLILYYLIDNRGFSHGKTT